MPASCARRPGSGFFEGGSRHRSRRPLTHFGRCWQNSLSKSILCGSFGFCQFRPEWVVQQRRCLSGSWPEAFGPTATGACSRASCCRQPRLSPIVADAGSGRSCGKRNGSIGRRSTARSSAPRGTGRSPPGASPSSSGRSTAAGPLPGCERSRLTLGFIEPGWSGSWRSFRRGDGLRRSRLASAPPGAEQGDVAARVRAAGSPHAAGLRVPSARKRSPRPTAKGLHYLQAL